MSDLIRKSEVISLLYEIFEKNSMATDKNSPLGGFGAEVFESVKAMSTAYDVDKVVKELEEAKTIDVDIGFGTICKTLRKDVVLEIVKQGGVGTETETIRDKAVKWNNNSTKRVPYEFIDYVEGKREIGASDDVCEWKQTSTARYKTSCGYKLEEYFDTNACYCKQCGKKIKVME